MILLWIPSFFVCCVSLSGLPTLIESNAKCPNLKNLPVKGLCAFDYLSEAWQFVSYLLQIRLHKICTYNISSLLRRYRHVNCTIKEEFVIFFILGCGVAQTLMPQLAVRQARVQIPARHPRESGEQWGNKSGSSANGCMNVDILMFRMKNKIKTKKSARCHQPLIF